MRPSAKSALAVGEKNLRKLISHRVHGVLREQSKKLCVLSGLCEIFKMKFHISAATEVTRSRPVWARIPY